MTQPLPLRVPMLAFAYELVDGDLVVDAWEDTVREVSDVALTTKDVTVTFADGSTETTTRRPGQQMLYDIQRLRTLLPPPKLTMWVEVEDDSDAPADDEGEAAEEVVP